MRISVLAAALLAAAVIASPAPAVDSAKPDTACFGLLFKDKAGDAVSAGPAANTSYKPDNLDLTEGFIKFHADTGETSINLRVKNLDKTIPEGATAIIWQMNYVGKAGADVWVRAMTDYSGLVTYDYGGLQDTPAIPFNVRQGGTVGAFFEGENGIVQIVIPESIEPKGQVLKTFNIHTDEAVQALPGAAPTPIKGGSLYEDDNAAGGKTTHTIGQACPAVVPGTPVVDVTPPNTKPVGLGQPLPVKLMTKSVKASKAKKSLALKLKSTEPITALAAQLKKGKKVVAKGSLKQINGAATLKLKVKKLKKGSYTLDLAGTDGAGARRFTAAKLKIS